MRTWKWYSKAALALLIAVFAWFVWPTPWAYPPQVMYLRRSRITGEVQRLTRGEWRTVGAASAEQRIREEQRALEEESAAFHRDVQRLIDEVAPEGKDLKEP